MGGGGGSITSYEPWEGIQPHLRNFYQQAANLYGQGGPRHFPGPTYTPPLQSQLRPYQYAAGYMGDVFGQDLGMPTSWDPGFSVWAGDRPPSWQGQDYYAPPGQTQDPLTQYEPPDDRYVGQPPSPRSTADFIPGRPPPDKDPIVVDDIPPGDGGGPPGDGGGPPGPRGAGGGPGGGGRGPRGGGGDGPHGEGAPVIPYAPPPSPRPPGATVPPVTVPPVIVPPRNLPGVGGRGPGGRGGGGPGGRKLLGPPGSNLMISGAPPTPTALGASPLTPQLSLTPPPSIPGGIPGLPGGRGLPLTSPPFTPMGIPGLPPGGGPGGPTPPPGGPVGPPPRPMIVPTPGGGFRLVDRSTGLPVGARR